LVEELNNPKMEQSQDSVSPNPDDNKDQAPVNKAEKPEETKKERILFEEKEKVAHDDFDWEAGNQLALPYTKSEIEEWTNTYDGTFKPINDHEIISGIVSSITNIDIVLNIGFKSDGLVSRSEFRDMPNIEVGDAVDVYVESKEDDNGQLVLSRKKAKLLKAWEGIVDSYNNKTIIEGTIISKTKGGLIVDVLGLETFLPGSQIDVKPITDYDAYVGITMEFKVVKINEAIKNAVVSHKALIESDLEEQRQKIIGQLEKGQVLEGMIKNITDFGAFIDLGGVDGLLYITDISWGRVNHPTDVLENGQKLNVVVLDFDDNKKRISLGLKQLQPHPWDVLGDDIQIGSTVKGKIVNIEDYGAFLEITPGVEGLIHVSEVSWSNQPINSREFFKLGELYDAKVVTIDREDRKMSLSVKQLTQDPWQEIEKEFPVESQHVGIVRNLTPYGVFVELKDGIGGMVHISDLSWTKRYNHPSEFTKVGKDLEVIVLEIDKDGRKLSLGHKQVEEDPWDTFETIFPKNSVHQGTIIKIDNKGGAIVALPYGVEAYAPKKFLKKETGQFAILDDELEFVIIDFNRDDKRILVSHSSVYRKKDDQPQQPYTGGGSSGGNNRSRRNNDNREKKSKDKPSSSNIQKTTLADLDVLSKLKEQLSSEEQDKAKAKLDKKRSEPKKEAPKKEEPKAETPKKEEPKAETPAKKEEPKAEAPKVEETPAKKEEPKAEEAPTKKEAPKAEEATPEVEKIEDKKEE